MATPVSKRIQQDRKSTFLDNISAQAVGEEQRKREKKNRERSSESGCGGGGVGAGGGKGTKRKTGKTAAGAGSSGAAKKVSLYHVFKLTYAMCARVLFVDPFICMVLY